MQRLGPDETELHGRRVEIDGQVLRDPVSLRIDWLVGSELIALATADGGWSTLYRDPVDSRYWELTYLQSEMHGGGPRTLLLMDSATARAKYEVP